LSHGCVHFLPLKHSRAPSCFCQSGQKPQIEEKKNSK